MKYPKLKPFRTTNAVFWLGLLAMASGILCYAYLFSKVRASGENISLLKQETSTLEAEQSEVGQLKKNLADTEASQQELSSYFIDASNIVPFLETVEGYGKSAGVSVVFSGVQINSAPVSLGASLTADGSFADLYRFTALLQAAPYEFSIDNAVYQLQTSLTPDPNAKSQAAAWQLTMNLSIASISGVSAAGTASPAAQQ